MSAFYQQPAAGLAYGAAPAAAASAPGARVKQQVGNWLICEDAQGEYYANQSSGQTYDTMPPELAALMGRPAPAPATTFTGYGGSASYAAAPGGSYAAPSYPQQYSQQTTYAAPTAMAYAAPASASYVPPAVATGYSSYAPPAQIMAPTTYATPAANYGSSFVPPPQYGAPAAAMPAMTYQAPRAGSFVPAPQSASFVPGPMAAAPVLTAPTGLATGGSFVPPPQPAYSLQQAPSMVAGGVAPLQSAPSMLAYGPGTQTGGFAFYADQGAPQSQMPQKPAGPPQGTPAPGGASTRADAPVKPMPPPGPRPAKTTKVRTTKKKTGCC